MRNWLIWVRRLLVGRDEKGVQRQAACAARSWSEADALRDQVATADYEVEDTPEGMCVDYLKRRKQIDRLVQRGEQLRVDIDWSEY